MPSASSTPTTRARVARGVQSARAYVNAINPLTFTSYTGFDPEVSAFGSTAYQGVDLGSYPQSRMVSVGMSVTF